MINIGDGSISIVRPRDPQPVLPTVPTAETSETFDLTTDGPRYIRVTADEALVIGRIPPHSEQPIEINELFVVVVDGPDFFRLDTQDVNVVNETTLTTIPDTKYIFAKKVAYPDDWDVGGGLVETIYPSPLITDVEWDGFWDAGGGLYQLTSPTNLTEQTTWVPEVGATNFTRNSAGQGWTYLSSHASFDNRPVLRSDGGDFMFADIPDVASQAGIHQSTILVAGMWGSTTGNLSFIDSSPGGRHLLQCANAKWGIHSGTAQTESGTTVTTTPFVALITSTGGADSKLDVNNVNLINANAGNSSLNGIRLGINQAGTSSAPNLTCIEKIGYMGRIKSAADENVIWSYFDSLTGYTIA